MNKADIIAYRLHNQYLATAPFGKPAEVVSALVAMQAQEYVHSKWAIGLRSKGLQDADIDAALHDGSILRTHIMRPTWHYVATKDIRWLQALTAHRVLALMAPYNRKMELDSKVFNKANKLLEKLLENDNYLTRDQLGEELAKHKIVATGQRLAHIMMQAELDAIICSGPRIGKQFTYALVAERAPKAKLMDKPEAMGLLAKQYFTTRGPATVHDFSWWSGLSVTEAKQGVESLPKYFIREKIDSKEFIYKDAPVQSITDTQHTFLLPAYDEYGISYKDRTALISDKLPKIPTTDVSHMIIVNGQFGGTWGRTVKSDVTTVELKPLPALNKTQQKAVEKAGKDFLSFTNNSK